MVLAMEEDETLHPISNDHNIEQVLHCGACVRESLSVGKDPSDYVTLEVGLTSIGVQVWCRRHRINVVHIDFGGAKPRANPNARVRVFDSHLKLAES